MVIKNNLSYNREAVSCALSVPANAMADSGSNDAAMVSRQLHWL